VAKNKRKDVIREPGTGANIVPVTPRAILTRPETTKWEKAQLMKRWREGHLTREEQDVAAAATAQLLSNMEGNSANGGAALEAALAAIQNWG
jgi:hypothetical protein